jgi:uncharacterized damage-inducible protein DinB
MPEVLQPEQASVLLNVALGALTQESRLTTKVITAIPLDRGDYRPDPVSKTALELAWHIVDSEIMFLEAVAEGKFTYGRIRPEPLLNSADIAAWYRENFRKSYHSLTRMSNEQLVKMTDFRGLFQRPAVMFLHTAIRHSAHHRGQLSVYLRPMGAKVPSIYGDSHDEAWPIKAGTAQNF